MGLAQTTEAASPVMSQTLQIHHSHVHRLQGDQEICLSRTRSSAKKLNRPAPFKLLKHPAAINLVATFEHKGGVVLKRRKPGHAVGAHPSPPAIQPKRLVGPSSCLRESFGKIYQGWAGEAEAELDGLFPALLLVGTTDDGSLFIVKQRDVDRTRPMALFKFRWRAHINQRSARRSKLIDSAHVCGSHP